MLNTKYSKSKSPALFWTFLSDMSRVEHAVWRTSFLINFLIGFVRPQREMVWLAYQSERPGKMNLILKQFPEKKKQVVQGL